MRVYSDKITPRIRYAVMLLLRDVLKAENITLTDHWDEFESYDGPKLIYGRKTLDGVPSIFNVDLLLETDISEQELAVQKDEEGTPSFFHTSAKSAFPFDIFAASFYLVSRYEEYLPHMSDSHDRYPPEESLAFQHDFLQIPVVNRWAKQLQDVLLSHDSRWVLPGSKFKYTSTVDVDNLYAYKGKGGFRTIGGFGKDLLQLRLRNGFSRFKVLFGFEKDPYDTFDFQRQLLAQYGHSAIYFMLFSEFGEFDRNIPMYSRRLHEAVRAINDFYPVGIHPSYGSHTSQKVLQKEVRGLESALRTPVTKSRQHFLKLTMPETFRQLADLGIKEDYTMGYAGQLGFRASIASAYKFYDLEMEVELDLTMYPFAIMDGTLIYYQEIPAKQAFQLIKPIIDEVKAVNGHLISVWHNRIFSEASPEWKGWTKVYRRILDYVNK